MAVALAQVRIPYDTAQPEDLSVNTFTFSTAGAAVTVAEANEIIDRLQPFYATAQPGSTNSLASYWASGVDLALASIKVYDLNALPPRAPLAEQIGELGVPGTTNNPSELCGTLSFQGIRQSGQVQARRRGRIYFGPLADTAFTSTYPIRLSAGFIAAGNAAMKYLALLSASPSLTKWIVWSRANLSGVDVQNGWVDNAVDIQRRRGEKSSTRTIWSL